MMIEELQLLAGEENPFTNSIITFFSFAIFGFFPLIPTIFAKSAGALTVTGTTVIYTLIVSVVFLGVIGACKSCVGGFPWYISIPETILVGAIAAAAAYGMGKAFSGG